MNFEEKRYEFIDCAHCVHDDLSCEECRNLNCEHAFCVGEGNAEYLEERFFPKNCAPIQDSGERREFESGAVRDIQEGKGRCDLLPLDVVAEFLGLDEVVGAIANFTETRNINSLFAAIKMFCTKRGWTFPEATLEVAKHFEDGCKKYGERNWEKGIPVYCYIDSAVRHYLKWLRGDTDERHDRAFVWNIICCIWTVKHWKGE